MSTHEVDRLQPLKKQERNILDRVTSIITCSGLARKYGIAMPVIATKHHEFERKIQKYIYYEGDNNPNSRLLRAVLGPQPFERLGELPLAICIEPFEDEDFTSFIEIVHVDPVYGKVAAGSELCIGEFNRSGQATPTDILSDIFTPEDLYTAAEIHQLQTYEGFVPKL
jgi:hypothetical protein